MNLNGLKLQEIQELLKESTYCPKTITRNGAEFWNNATHTHIFNWSDHMGQVLRGNVL